MKITKEVTTKNDFNFWSGAVYTVDELTDEEFEQVINELDLTYPEGMTETELNDLFWFEDDFVAVLLGYNNWEELEDDEDRK